MPIRSHQGIELPIQPYVPVGPGERTELYSYEQLRAFAGADPRNELDELSEPGRFKKGLLHPVHRQCQGGGLLLGFLAGAALGGALAALTTPKTGSELRGDLNDFACRAKRKVKAWAEGNCRGAGERAVFEGGDSPRGIPLQQEGHESFFI